MKNFLSSVFACFLLTSVYSAQAEDAAPVVSPDPSPSVSAAEPVVTTTPAPEVSTVASPATDMVAAAVQPASPAPTAPMVTDQAAASPTPSTENLEFISGEIASMDEATKTITVKLYGETEQTTSDKIVSIKLDDTTDITDGEKDRDIKSLTQGTEVDVEYDPATSKATYIFVY